MEGNFSQQQQTSSTSHTVTRDIHLSIPIGQKVLVVSLLPKQWEISNRSARDIVVHLFTHPDMLPVRVEHGKLPVESK